MKSKEKPSLKTGAHFVSGSLKITRKTDEEQERHGLKQNPTYIWYVILEQAVPDEVSRRLARSSEGGVNGIDSLLIIEGVHTHDDIKLGRALVYHADVDVCVGKRAEKCCGSALS